MKNTMKTIRVSNSLKNILMSGNSQKGDFEKKLLIQINLIQNNIIFITI